MDYGLLYIIGQIFGVIAVVLGFVTFQRKTQLEIIIYRCVTAVLFSIHYILISAPTAAALNFLSAIISVFFAFRDKMNKRSISEVVVCSLLIVVAAAFSWENIYSVFLIAGLVLNVVSLSFSNPQNTRRAMLVKSPLCIVYNLAVKSVGGIVFEVAVFISAIIGLVKNKIKDK